MRLGDVSQVGRKSVKFIITEACEEIQNGPLNRNSERALYLLKHKVCGEAPYIGKVKTNFDIGSEIINANIELSGK